MNMADPWQVLIHSLTIPTKAQQSKRDYDTAAYREELSAERRAENEFEIVECLKRNKVMSHVAMAEELEKSVTTIKRYLNLLEAEGVVRVAFKGATALRYWELV